MAENKIVVRKIKNKGHQGGHGGSSWKVAYADFVTAMMAFFLLMWLLAMVEPQKRANLAEYFNHFNIFEQYGQPISTGGGTPSSPVVLSEEAGAAPTTLPPRSSVTGQIVSGPAETAYDEELKSELTKMVEEELSDIRDQVIVDTFEGGVRVQVVDKQGHPMFALGKTDLTPEGKRALSVLAKKLTNLDNNLAVEGHTDSLGFANSKYTNWELSTDRASAARQELERNGLSPDRIIRVAGYAATEPLVKDDAANPKNRRISILIYSKKSQTTESRQPLRAEEAFERAIEKTERQVMTPSANTNNKAETR